MASLASYVTLTITRDSVGVARAGFGVPLIMSPRSTAFSERLRYYDSLDGLADDGFDPGSFEYEEAAAAMSQSPHPSRFAIGRPGTSATIVRTIGVAAVRNSFTYSVDIEGESGFDPQAVSYTSDSSATEGEILSGLAAALNAVVGKTYSAAVVSTSVVLTGAGPGVWFSAAVNPADLSMVETSADNGIAADLAAIALESSDWYAISTAVNSNAAVLAAAAWAQANGKIYIPSIADTGSITGGLGNGDTIDDLHTAGYSRVAAIYHPSPAAHAGAAWEGSCLPLDPGSETWMYKRLAGVPAVSLTSTQRGNLVAKAGNSYETVAGVPLTFNGTTADGDFIDVRRGLDWLEDDMSKGIFGALAGASKIPYTDRGMAVLEAQVRASLRRAETAGIIAAGWTVTVPKVADQSDSDRALRTVRNIRFAATLAGAVHKVNVAGVVSV